MRKTERSDALAAALSYFNGDALAADVWTSKYALHDSQNVYYETSPRDMHVRIAREFARIEAKYPNGLSEQEIMSLIEDVNVLNDKEIRTFGMVIPQGSPMSAIGNHLQLQSLSNCFVIPSPHDSYGGILYADQLQAQIMKRRGGVGFDVSTIRPRGQPTSNAARTTDGIGVFMERFSNTCREVAQGGRRGALMLSIDVNHPQIETFINIKRDKKKVTGANVSVKVSDAFMNAVVNDTEFTLQWPTDVPLERAEVTKVVRAKDVWEQLIDAAWYSAEPGILFWDTMIRETPSSAYDTYRPISTNPCAEICLSAYNACRLMIVNVTKFVKNPYTKDAYFDYSSFEKISQKAQRLMDDLVDLEVEAIDKILAKINLDPEPQHVKQIELELWENIKKAAIGGRETGLGITGLGDALAMLGVKYGSQNSIEITENIYRHLAIGAYKSSITLAEERGHFPDFDLSLERNHPFIQRVLSQLDDEWRNKYELHGRRNVALLTTAPVGSTSMLTQTTSGIEPAYLLSYKRRRKINPDDTTTQADYVDEMGDKWQQYDVYHHGLQQWMNVTGNKNIEESPYWGATALDTEWTNGVKLQAAAQRWICHSISRTSNLPKNAAHDLVSQIYIEAWKSGCKGFTVYRDGSRQGVLLSGTEAQAWFDNIPTEELEKLLEIGRKNKHVMPAGYVNFLENDVANEIQKRQGEFSVNLLRDTAPPKFESLDVLPIKRPKKVACDIHRVRVMTNGESHQYMVLVGLVDNKPYEIFCGLSKHVELPRKIQNGFIVKNGRKKPGNIATYNLMVPLEAGESLTFKDIVEQFENPEYGALSRTISLVLRHGIPIQFLVEQLQKDKESDLMSFSRAISRVLKEYIPNGTKATGDKCCPECNSEDMIYQEGCVTCVSCGWSKCS